MAEAENDRREGRGWLSSIDRLPDEAQPDVVWALEELRERKRTQTAILAEFNERLAAKDIAPISRPSWSRYAVRKAIQFRKLDEVRRLTADIVSNLGTDGPDQVTVAVAEMIKVAAYELLEGGVNSKGLQEVSRAVQTAVNAQKSSAEARRKLEEDVEQRLTKARVAIEGVGKKAGVSPETLAEINRALGAG